MNALEDQTVDHIVVSFGRVVPRASELTERFYARLFIEAPELRALFPDSLEAQKRKLFATLVQVVSSVRDLAGLAPQLRELGARHVNYGARPEHYAVVASLLVEVMAELVGSAWCEADTRAWLHVLGQITAVMLADDLA